MNDKGNDKELQEYQPTASLRDKINNFLRFVGRDQIEIINETLRQQDRIENKINNSTLSQESKTRLLSAVQKVLNGLQQLAHSVYVDSLTRIRPMPEFIGKQIQKKMLESLEAFQIADDEFYKANLHQTLGQQLKQQLKQQQIPSPSSPFTAGQILALINAIILLVVFVALAIAVAFIPLVSPFLVGLAIAVSKFIGFTALTTALTTTATAITLPFTVAGVGAAVMAGVLLVVDAGVAVGLGIKNRKLRSGAVVRNVPDFKIQEPQEKNETKNKTKNETKDEPKKETKNETITNNIYQNDTIPCRVNFMRLKGAEQTLGSLMKATLFADEATLCYVYCETDHRFFVFHSDNSLRQELTLALSKKPADVEKILGYFTPIEEDSFHKVTFRVNTQQVNELRSVLSIAPSEENASVLLSSKLDTEDEQNQPNNKQTL